MAAGKGERLRSKERAGSGVPSAGSSDRADGAYHVQALDRGLDVLCRIAESADGIPLEGVMKATKLSKATAFRLIWNLERRGFVRRSHNGGYALGHKVLELTDAYQQQFPLADLSIPYLRALRDETSETTGLIVRAEGARVCVMCLDSPKAVRRTLHLGNMGPLYRGAAGRMLLAYLPRDEQERCLVGVDRIDHANGASLSKEEFLLDLSRMRAEGVALSYMDSEPDIWAVAAPVFDRAGLAVAAIACTGPVNRFEEEHVAHCRVRTISAARRLSIELGWKDTHGEVE